MAASLRSLVDAARPQRGPELLVKTIAGDDRTALAAWSSWRKTSSIAAARGADQRLLAAVGRRLSKLDLDRDDRADLATVSRDVWLSNQLRLQAHKWIFEHLAEAGLPMMLLKGGARIASRGWSDRDPRGFVTSMFSSHPIGSSMRSKY